MREIKFRGKDLKTNEWVYGNLSHYNTEKDAMIECVDYDDKKMLVTTHFVNLNTIGQFTGLKDKNDKEIYEGDILKNNLSELPFAIVCWHQNGYFFCDCNMGRHPTDYEYNEYTPLGEVLNFHIDSKKVEYEVIGNIYDNKELLNQ